MFDLLRQGQRAQGVCLVIGQRVLREPDSIGVQVPQLQNCYSKKICFLTDDRIRLTKLTEFIAVGQRLIRLMIQAIPS